MGIPPDAWTLIIQAPVCTADSTACATVLGISWNLRSRNTRAPRVAETAYQCRALEREQAAADFEPAGDAVERRRQLQGACAGVDVERDEKLIHVWRPHRCRSYR